MQENNIKRVLGGRKAKIHGIMSEKYFIRSAISSGYYVLDLPQSGGKFINIRRNFVPLKMPFDLVLAKNTKAYFIDVKSVRFFAPKSKNYSLKYSIINAPRKKHQLYYLHEAWTMGDVTSGFVVYNNRNDCFYFCHIKHLLEVKPKGSLKLDENNLLGNNERIGDLEKFYIAPPNKKG